MTPAIAYSADGSRRLKAVTLRIPREAIDRDRGPMKERRLVHRDVAVFEREQDLSVLDHLLDEHAFDRLVAAAYVAHAEPMEGQDCDDAITMCDKGSGRWNSARDIRGLSHGSHTAPPSAVITSDRARKMLMLLDARDRSRAI